MADSKRQATAIAVSIALLTTGEHAVAQSASELETRLEAGATTTTRPGNALPLSALAVTPGFRYADHRFTVSARGSAWLSNNHVEMGSSAAAIEAYTPLL